MYINNTVLLKQNTVNKFMAPYYIPDLYKVTWIKRTMVTAKNEPRERKITRNASYFK